LNLNNFKMIEAMRLENIASRSPWMALSPYQISWHSKAVQKLLVGDRQTGDLISLLSCLENRLKIWGELGYHSGRAHEYAVKPSSAQFIMVIILRFGAAIQLINVIHKYGSLLFKSSLFCKYGM
jgi:hypothetical protein